MVGEKQGKFIFLLIKGRGLIWGEWQISKKFNGEIREIRELQKDLDSLIYIFSLLE